MALNIFLPKPNSYHFGLVLLLLFMNGKFGYAANYYSNPVGNTGNFNANGVWSLTPGGATVNFPGTTHTFYITTGDNITIGANQTAGGIIVESGGTLTMSGNRTVTCPQVTINSGGLFALTTTRPTFSGNITNNGSITGTTARITANTGTFINGGSIALTTGYITRTTGSFTNSGTVTLGAGRFTATTGAFTNEATGTFSVTGTLALLTLGTGNFVNNNTSASVSFGSTAVTISGTANQSIGGFTTTGRFTASKTAGTTTLTGNINSGGITKSGAGILNMGAGLTHTTTNSVVLTAGTMNGSSSTINITFLNAAAWTGAIATVFVPQTSTVNFSGAGAQGLNATGVSTFYNLTFSNSGAKTIVTANTVINNIFSLEGTATSSLAPTYGASATLRYNTATSRTVGAEWLATFAATGGVIIDNTGAIITNGNKVFNINIPLTINSGATLSPAAGNTFSFGGDLINNGTWTPSTGQLPSH